MPKRKNSKKKEIKGKEEVAPTASEIVKKPRRVIKRGKSKGTENYYFTKVHEDAIAAYVRAKDDTKLRNELYTNIIRPVFDEMVDKIVYTFKFTTLPNIDALREDCKVWLTTVLDKFNPDKGTKAFSYFSVITKNWMIHQTKTNQKQSQREVVIDAVPKALEQKYLSSEPDFYYDDRTSQEFVSAIRKDMEFWCDGISGSIKQVENDERVLKAVHILFDNIDNIEIFNKKAVYFYLREITGFNTKQIAISLKKIKDNYSDFKEAWDDEEDF